MLPALASVLQAPCTILHTPCAGTGVMKVRGQGTGWQSVAQMPGKASLRCQAKPPSDARQPTTKALCAMHYTSHTMQHVSAVGRVGTARPQAGNRVSLLHHGRLRCPLLSRYTARARVKGSQGSGPPYSVRPPCACSIHSPACIPSPAALALHP